MAKPKGEDEENRFYTGLCRHGQVAEDPSSSQVIY